MALTPYEETFLVKEHAALRLEVLQTLKEAREVERNVVAAVAVVVVWLGKDVAKDHLVQRYWLVWWVPFLLVLLGIARSAAILRLFGVLSQYIKQIEVAFLSKCQVQGWEHFSEPRKTFISTTGILLWAALLLGTLGLGICHPK